MIAIDVLIEPDAAMTDKAKRVNARLRENYPQGYAFDASHVPHITLLQRFVRASDIEKIGTAVIGALGMGPALPIELVATGYSGDVWTDIGVLVYALERSRELLALADEVEVAVRPFAMSGGTAD